MDVTKAIRERQTTGAFSDVPVDDDTLRELIGLAVWAPNHRTTEPWRFHVVSGPARERMADAIQTWLSESAADTSSAAAVARKKLTRSPLFVVVSQVRRPDDPVIDLEDYAACCCATQNLLLAAHERGLATKWSTGKLAEYEGAKRFLGLGPDDRIVAYVYIGYPPDGLQEAVRERSEPAIDWRS